MGLKIRDPEAYRLAKLIAKETGTNITETVIEALRGRLKSIRQSGDTSLSADLHAIAERASRHMRRPSTDHDQLLYDKHGLPKRT